VDYYWADPYRYCQWGDSIDPSTVCLPVATAISIWRADRFTSSVCDDDDRASCNACLCAVQCESDDDCSPGLRGSDAVHRCLGSALPGVVGPKKCLLTCDGGETCPSGMQCVHIWEYGHRVCAWISHGDRCEIVDGGSRGRER
jgi:hypothetical protein